MSGHATPHMECEEAAVAAGRALQDLTHHMNGRAYRARLEGDYDEASRIERAAEAVKSLSSALWSVALLLDNPANKATR